MAKNTCTPTYPTDRTVVVSRGPNRPWPNSTEQSRWETITIAMATPRHPSRVGRCPNRPTTGRSGCGGVGLGEAIMFLPE